MASPVEQDRRRIEVLHDALDQRLVEFPRWLGVTIDPEVPSVIHGPNEDASPVSTRTEPVGS